jgi:hypothetical protein
MSLIYKKEDGKYYGKCHACGALTGPLGADRAAAWEQFDATGWVRPGHSSERKHLCYQCAPVKIIAVDFDGCLVENAYPDIGPAIPQTVATLKAEQAAGAKVILWTCRHDDPLAAAVEWCAAQGIHLDAVNANLPHMIELYGETRKVGATEYWDDKAVQIPAKTCGECGFKYHSNAVGGLPNCNDCGRQKGCEYAPAPGQWVRINCPHWEGTTNE